MVEHLLQITVTSLHRERKAEVRTSWIAGTHNRSLPAPLSSTCMVVNHSKSWIAARSPLWMLLCPALIWWVQLFYFLQDQWHLNKTYSLCIQRCTQSHIHKWATTLITHRSQFHLSAPTATTILVCRKKLTLCYKSEIPAFVIILGDRTNTTISDRRRQQGLSKEQLTMSYQFQTLHAHARE